MTDTKQIDDGGPAFSGATKGFQPGMSLRAWFAGQAMAGLLAYEGAMGPGHESDHARVALACADALIAALKEPQS